MAVVSFNSGISQIRVVADEAGADQKIASEANALKVAGTFLFEEDSIQTFPRQDYQAFLDSTVCLFESIIKELKVMNQHLASLTDEDKMAQDLEPESQEGAW